MPDFDPHPVCPPYDFYIKCDRRGHWIVRERSNLAGGVFLTRGDAMRFALSETGGYATHVHARAGAALAPHQGGPS